MVAEGLPETGWTLMMDGVSMLLSKRMNVQRVERVRIGPKCIWFCVLGCVAGCY